jgi:hypothetical protein
MGTTEPNPHLNNPAQTDNNSTDITHVLHQDQHEDADQTENGTSFRISIEFRTIQSNRSHHDMISANFNSFLQQLLLEDNSLQLQLLDRQEGELELVPIDALISPKLETEGFNRLVSQYNRTMRPYMTKIVPMVIQVYG